LHQCIRRLGGARTRSTVTSVSFPEEDGVAIDIDGVRSSSTRIRASVAAGVLRAGVISANVGAATFIAGMISKSMSRKSAFEATAERLPAKQHLRYRNTVEGAPGVQQSCKHGARTPRRATDRSPHARRRPLRCKAGSRPAPHHRATETSPPSPRRRSAPAPRPPPRSRAPCPRPRPRRSECDQSHPM
jgi:hypothetical protein